MKKAQIIFMLMIAMVIGHWSMVAAQSISRKVVSTAGGTLTGGGSMITYSIGEAAVQTLTAGSNQLTLGFEQPGEQIITGAVTNAICAGSSISVPFNAIDIGGGNTFTAQLSNASGSFAVPVTIGTLSGNASGTISASIPTNTPAGLGYRIRVISNSPGETGSDNGSNIAVNSLPNPSIAGNSVICAGSSLILNAGAYSTYNWSTGVATQTISASTAGTYTVTVTNANGCTGTASKTITVSPLPVPSITVTSGACVTATLTATAGFANYSWSTGATTQSIVSNIAGTYTVTVTNGSGCTGSASAAVTGSGSVPPQPGAISGLVAVCKNSNATYSIAAVPGATNYTWTATSGASISTGQGSTTVVVNFSNSATAASLLVVAVNACGSSTPTTLAYAITSAVPNMPVALNGQLWGLCNKNNVAYSCPAVANATSYVWTVPAGVTILGGQGTNAITAKYTSSFAPTGTISVAAVSGCGTSAAMQKTVNAKPQQPVIAGQNWACAKQQGVFYSVAPVTGAISYTWTVVSGSTIVSGQGTTSITVNWGQTNGVIKCSANNTCGSSLPSQLAVAFTCKDAGTIADFSELNLYPNPASTNATISFDGYAEGRGQLAVYDLIGKQVLKQDIAVVTGNNNFKLDLSSYAKGAYMVRVSYNGVVGNCKLIVE